MISFTVYAYNGDMSSDLKEIFRFTMNFYLIFIVIDDTIDVIFEFVCASLLIASNTKSADFPDFVTFIPACILNILPACFALNVGFGNAFLSIFPLLVNGKESKQIYV